MLTVLEIGAVSASCACLASVHTLRATSVRQWHSNSHCSRLVQFAPRDFDSHRCRPLPSAHRTRGFTLHRAACRLPCALAQWCRRCAEERAHLTTAAKLSARIPPLRGHCYTGIFASVSADGVNWETPVLLLRSAVLHSWRTSDQVADDNTEGGESRGHRLRVTLVHGVSLPRQSGEDINTESEEALAARLEPRCDNSTGSNNTLCENCYKPARLMLCQYFFDLRALQLHPDGRRSLELRPMPPTISLYAEEQHPRGRWRVSCSEA